MSKDYDNMILELNQQLRSLEKTLRQKCKVFEKMSSDYDIIDMDPRYNNVKDTLYNKILIMIHEMNLIQQTMSNVYTKIDEYQNLKLSILDTSLITFSNPFLVI